MRHLPRLTLRTAAAVLSALSLATPALADEGEDVRLALAEQLLEATVTGGLMEQTLNAFATGVDQAHSDLYAKLANEIHFDRPEQRAVFRARYEESRSRFRQQFRELYAERLDLDALSRRIYAPIYARHLTETELRDATAFYSSPSGKAVLEKSPVILGEGMQLLIQEIAPTAQAIVVEALDRERERLVGQYAN